MYKSSGWASYGAGTSAGRVCYHSLFQVLKLGGRRKRYVSRKNSARAGVGGSVRAKERCSILLVLRAIFV